MKINERFQKKKSLSKIKKKIGRNLKYICVKCKPKDDEKRMEMICGKKNVMAKICFSIIFVITDYYKTLSKG